MEMSVRINHKWFGNIEVNEDWVFNSEYVLEKLIENGFDKGKTFLACMDESDEWDTDWNEMLIEQITTLIEVL